MLGKKRTMFGGIAAVLLLAIGAMVWPGAARWTIARLRPGTVQAAALGAGGQIWIGTDAALFRVTAAGVRERGGLANGVRQLLVDPGNPAQMYALTTTGRIMRSQDGGRAWRQVHGHGLPAEPIRAFAYDPSGPLRLVAIVAGRGYYQSDLEGETWMQLGSQDIPDATSMAVSPLDPRTVLIGTGTGLYRSTNQGMRFEPVSARHAWDLQGPVHGLAVAGDRSAMLAATDRGVYRSVDGGRSWSRLADTGLPDIVTVAVDPGHSRVILAAARSGALAVSRDGGYSWQPVREK